MGSPAFVAPKVREFKSEDFVGFHRLSTQLKKLTGINLDDSSRSQTLVNSRTRAIYAKYNISTYNEIAKLLEAGNQGFIKDFVSALTTNTTNFFRESKHFDFLKNELKTMLSTKIAKNDMEMRIWCAACSTGQEAYSIGSVAMESLKDSPVALKILASDIDFSVLKIADRGIYPRDEAKSIPFQYISKYFYYETIGKVSKLRATSALRRQIKFASLNLIEPFPFKSQFDVIFCRNVFIYFEPATVKAIVGKMARSLKAGGLLFVGHSEAMIDFDKNILERVSASVYRKK